MGTTYISYGHKYYDPKKFDKIKNRKDNFWINKPEGGLWAADILTDDWQGFCIDNGYRRHRYNRSNSFTFTLSDNARVLKLRTDKDCADVLRKYALVDKRMNRKKEESIFNKYVLDYERIAQDYDVIDYKDEICQSCFPYWDIDCILVLHQEVIRPL